MIAPRRAIGVPSAAVSVIEGGVGGLSDCDKGAVIASQAISSTSRMSIAPSPRMIHRIEMRGRRRAGARSGGGAPASSCQASKSGMGPRGSPGEWL